MENPSGLSQKVQDMEDSIAGLCKDLSVLKAGDGATCASLGIQEHMWKECLGPWGLITQVKHLL